MAKDENSATIRPTMSFAVLDEFPWGGDFDSSAEEIRAARDSAAERRDTPKRPIK